MEKQISLQKVGIIMSNIIAILFCLLILDACDTIRGRVSFYNNSKETIYVFVDFEDKDSMPLIPRRVFLNQEHAGAKDLYGVGGGYSEPKLVYGKCLTLYILTADMANHHSLKEIHDKQIYKEKKTFSEEELKKMNWKIVYPFDSTKVNR